MNKKAALEMSVQSIVVFVITFIVLGIIISLIVSMFDTVEDQLVILDRAPQTNPTMNNPLDVQGGRVSVRANTDSRIVFGVLLNDTVRIGETIHFIPINVTVGAAAPLAQATNPTGGALPPVRFGRCEGIGTGFATYTIAVNQQIAPRTLSAGSVVELAVTMRTPSAPGRYTCFAAAVNATASGAPPHTALAFGSFELEIR